jgi:hypothetical protein
MREYNIRTLFGMVIDVAGPFPCSDQGNQYLLIAVDYCTKWLETFAIPNQKSSIVAEVLVINFCCLGLP